MQGYGCVGLHAFTVNLRTSVYMRLSMMHAVSPKACLMLQSFFIYKATSWPRAALARLRRVKGVMLTITAW